MKESDLKKEITRFLELIKSEWKLQETINKLPSDDKRNTSRETLITNAIENLEVNPDIDKLLETLHTNLSKTNANKKDISDIIKIKTSIKLKELERNTNTQSRTITDDNKHDNKPAAVEQMVPYLERLKLEWEYKDSTLHPKDKHSEYRTKLISDAIVAIGSFKQSDYIIKVIYQDLIDQLQTLPGAKDIAVSERTNEAIQDIARLSHFNALSLRRNPFKPRKNNAFIGICNTAISAKYAYNLSNFNNEIREDKHIEEISNLLQCIKDTLKIQEIKDNLSDDMRTTSRDGLIALAINDLKRLPSSAIDRTLDILLTALANEEKNSNTKQAIERINHIKAISRRILINFEAKELEIKTNDESKSVTDLIPSYDPTAAILPDNVADLKRTDSLTKAAKMINYLDALKEEWTTKSNAIASGEDKANHSNNRIQLVTNAIAAIKAFETTKSTEQMDIIYEVLSKKLKKLRKLDKHANRELTERTKEIANNIHILTGNNLPIVDENDTFTSASKNHIQSRKDTIQAELELKSQDLDLVDFNDFKIQIIHYLKCIRDEFTTQELAINDLPQNSSSRKRNILIGNAILNIEINDKIDITKVEEILVKLNQDLIENAPPKISYYTRRSENETAMLSETKASAESINEILRISENIIESLKNKKIEENKNIQDEKKHNESEDNKAFMRGSPEEIKDPTVPSSAEIKRSGVGYAHIVDSLNNAIKKEHPLFTRNHRLENKDDKESDAKREKNIGARWRCIRAGVNIADLPRLTQSILEGTVKCSGLANGKCNEYFNKDTKTVIREERKDNYIQISMPEKPHDYDQLSEEKKYEIDIQNAEAIVRLWVDSCGNSLDNPVLISDSCDKRLMKAIIVVCQGNGLDFLAPLSSHDLITNSDLLENETKAFDTYKGAEINKIKITKEVLKTLHEDIQKLKFHCEEQANTKTPEEKKAYTDLYDPKIKKLEKLITDVRNQELSVKDLEAAIHEANIDVNPPMRRLTR